jgi:hypothetical protein
MRQNLVVALLSVIATLLAVTIFSPPSSVSGQNTGGTATIGNEVAVATGPLQGGSGSAFWLYLPARQKLAVYVLGGAGLELRAVRDIQYDLQATDLNLPQGKTTKVRDIKKEISKSKDSE